MSRLRGSPGGTIPIALNPVVERSADQQLRPPPGLRQKDLPMRSRRCLIVLEPVRSMVRESVGCCADLAVELCRTQTQHHCVIVDVAHGRVSFPRAGLSGGRLALTICCLASRRCRVVSALLMHSLSADGVLPAANVNSEPRHTTRSPVVLFARARRGVWSATTDLLDIACVTSILDIAKPIGVLTA